MENLNHRSIPSLPLTNRQLLASLLFVLALLGGIILFGIATDLLGLKLPPLMVTVVLTLSELLLLIPPWYFLLRRGGTWADLGIRGFRIGYLATGCSLLLLSFFFNLAWAIFLTYFNLQGQPEVLPLFGEGPGAFLIALLVAGVVGPFVEEVYFRGFLFAGLRGNWGTLLALLVSSALFAIFHILPTTVPPIFVLGLFLGLLYHLSGSLWPSILMHAATNILALTVAYYAGQAGI
ncbi:MAG: CPBP family intramembrane metalloprotease [Chloroflexi bacterium]|nr:CPBP family intramembrane metalloprotease [Chloroflexota bacterium]